MHKRAILVTGDTLSVKTQLKALGGNWNRGLIGWIFPGSKRAEVVALHAQKKEELIRRRNHLKVGVERIVQTGASVSGKSINPFMAWPRPAVDGSAHCFLGW